MLISTVTLVGQDELLVVLRYFDGMIFLASAQLLPAGTFTRSFCRTLFALESPSSFILSSPHCELELFLPLVSIAVFKFALRQHTWGSGPLLSM